MTDGSVMADPDVQAGTPAVSVVIPIYNQQEYIGECLESLLRQTFTDFEVLAVDDGSTDKTADIITQFANRDPRVRLIGQPNGGVSSARNTGLTHARGAWICFIDPDDYVADGYLRTLYDVCEGTKDTPDIVMSTCIACDGEHKARQRFFPESFTASTREEKQPLFHQLLDGSYLQSKGFVTAIGVPWGKLYRHAFITGNGLRFDPQLSRMEDNLFNIQAFHAARRIVYLDYAGYYYRVSDLMAHTYGGILQGTFHHAIDVSASMLDAYGLLDDEAMYRAWNAEQVNLYFQELKAAAASQPHRLRDVRRACAQCMRTLRPRMHSVDRHALSRGERLRYAALTDPVMNGAMAALLWLKSLRG
ncbi:glycosyltransferase [Bifidobacterium italicum]|uniref:Glycosyltransferase n=1 Tax=Bifidobacterium italicum TaxID=1960968 RepID=A0A2A2EN72_9BIFI|nr:glycosyltransferase [Bifidobacterium italicum]PAU70240.1 glycosyltransferase [Bifidobacterium italicum]